MLPNKGTTKWRHLDETPLTSPSASSSTSTWPSHQSAASSSAKPSGGESAEASSAACCLAERNLERVPRRGPSPALSLRAQEQQKGGRGLSNFIKLHAVHEVVHGTSVVEKLPTCRRQRPPPRPRPSALPAPTEVGACQLKSDASTFTRSAAIATSPTCSGRSCCTSSCARCLFCPPCKDTCNAATRRGLCDG